MPNDSATFGVIRPENAAAWLAAIVESSNDAIIGKTLDGVVRTWNAAAERLFGHSQEEAIGQSVLMLIPEDLRGEEVQIINRLKQGERIENYETVRVTKDGTRIDVSLSVSPIYDGSGEIIGATKIARDITEAKRLRRLEHEMSELLQEQATELELQIEESRFLQDRLREQFRKLPVPTYMLELSANDFVLVDFNDAGRPLLSSHRSQWIGRSSAELFPESWDICDAATRALRQNTVVKRNVSYLVGTGTEQHAFELTIGPQAPDRVVLHVIDTTEQTRLANELRQAQKMEVVGQLAGGVAHDFNNLLTVIGAHSAFLLEGLASDDARREDARAVQEAGERAGALTRQLLAFSRKQILQPTVVDLNHVVEHTYRMLDRLIGEDIEVVRTLATDLSAVLVDVGQVEQVLMNLVLNGRDAMPQGGRLNIVTRNVAAVDHSERVPRGDYVVLSVGDTGSGIDTATQARMFEPFFTTKAMGKGTGLGLSTVYGIVKQSGGHIVVDSTPGHGARFDVYLPAVAATSVPEPERRVAAHRAAGAETVLLVEDDHSVREITRRVLAREGYHVLEAANGRAALSLAESYEGHIDLVITDAVMPGMTGVAVLNEVRLRRPGCKAILVSGYTDDDVMRRGTRSADVHFIQKPFTPADFARQVRQVLES